MLRKINAVLSLVITWLLLVHAIINGVWMLSRGAFTKAQNPLAFILFMLMMLHAIMCIVLLIRAHKGAEKRKCKGYPNMNAQTYIQRIGGALLILFTVLHIAGTKGVLNPPKLVHSILPPLFFAMALMHVAISTSKALITLGVGNAKVIKRVDIIIKILCVIILIADVIGFYLYLC